MWFVVCPPPPIKNPGHAYGYNGYLPSITVSSNQSWAPAYLKKLLGKKVSGTRQRYLPLLKWKSSAAAAICVQNSGPFRLSLPLLLKK